MKWCVDSIKSLDTMFSVYVHTEIRTPLNLTYSEHIIASQGCWSEIDLHEFHGLQSLSASSQDSESRLDEMFKTSVPNMYTSLSSPILPFILFAMSMSYTKGCMGRGAQRSILNSSTLVSASIYFATMSDVVA
ncbi:hypothetical protein Mapa_006674 [Marchantia paleacea]|nr:hypothetical protein Mapa_006674 [Marchantia paleacea]